MGLVTRIIVMLIAMASVVFVMYKLNTTGIDPAIFYLEPGYTPSFQTNDVTHFEWKAANKIFSFDKDQAGGWLPKKNEKNLKDLLSFLSSIPLNTVEQKGVTPLEVVLDIKGERWTGAWDGLSFLWKSGPQAGKGAVLTEPQNRVFFKGAFVFDTYQIDLCKTRINKILIQANGKNYQIEQLNRGWEVTQPQSQKLDPIVIEKWLIGLCQVNVKTILDLAYAQSNTREGFVTFEFVNGDKLALQQVKKDFFTTQRDGKELGLVIDQLAPALNELKKQLQP